MAKTIGGGKALAEGVKIENGYVKIVRPVVNRDQGRRYLDYY